MGRAELRSYPDHAPALRFLPQTSAGSFHPPSTKAAACAIVVTGTVPRIHDSGKTGSVIAQICIVSPKSFERSSAVSVDRIRRNSRGAVDPLGLTPGTAVIQRDPAALFRTVRPVLLLLVEDLPAGRLNDIGKAVVMAVAIVKMVAARWPISEHSAFRSSSRRLSASGTRSAFNPIRCDSRSVPDSCARDSRRSACC